jgi:hypothetical protein
MRWEKGWTMPEPVLGHRTFTDGSTRLVHADARGQYVFDDDGNRVCGVYLVPEEETADLPVIVEAAARLPG